MKQDMKEFMAKVSEDEGLRVKLEAVSYTHLDVYKRQIWAVSHISSTEILFKGFFWSRCTSAFFNSVLLRRIL